MLEKLIEKISSYDPKFDRDKLNQAWELCKSAHKGQMRASGEDYHTHPLAVAEIVADMKLDQSSIITALLHDTVEDTRLTSEDIKEQFGDDVANLVDGVTKLSKIKFESEKSRQAENFRKLFLALSKDIRVLLVKLSDRLHNMRTLHYLKSEEKRKRIAHETMEIFVPLAERMGIHHIKEELQDLSFSALQPEVRKSILKRLEFLRKSERSSSSNKIDNTIEEMKRLLAQANITAEITGREKKPWSILQKMERQGIGFEQLSDIVAFRVIVADIALCYQTLGVIHEKWHMIPESFKDYISTPKPNGYQSLHTTVLGPNQHRIEIQIRTEEMHQIAEMGVAAHWSYKQDIDVNKSVNESTQYRWIRGLMEILDRTEGAEEFLEHTKLEMYHDQVFAFTPRGDLIVLPRGATPVDFAYAIHSDIGNKCIGARLNGKIVPLNSQIRNGDQVDIISGSQTKPNPNWERFVITGKARSAIRRYIRMQQRDEYVALGKAMLEKTMRAKGYTLKERELEPVVKLYNMKEQDDLYYAIGEGTVSRYDIINHIHPQDPDNEAEKRNIWKRTFARLKRKPTLEARETKDSASLPIVGLVPGMAVHFAGCCHPIPGDKIVGIVTTGKGVTIHTSDCETLENFSDSPERWLDVNWDNATKANQNYIGRIRVILSHEAGALAALSNAIGEEQANISNLKIVNRSSDFFEILLDIELRDAFHLNSLLSSLRTKRVVHSAERFRN